MIGNGFTDFLFHNRLGMGGIAAIIIGALLVPLALYGLQEIYYWQEHGVKAHAIVTDKYVREECNSGSSGTRSCIDNHYVIYDYTLTGNQAYSGKDSLNKTDWDALSKGSSVAMLYSHIAPSKSSLAYATGHMHQQAFAWKAVMVVGGLLVIVGITLIKITHRRFKAL